jgi:diguanylate cyclase (GGDEF)-like protein/PAS domain S-box-containing protein
LEEILTGDTEVDIQKDVMIPFENKSYKAYLALAEKILITHEEKQYLQQLQDINKRLDFLLVLTKKRWVNSNQYGIGSEEDQTFDAEFNKILEMVDTLSLTINNKINLELANQNNYFNLIVVLFLLINLSIFVILSFYRRKQKAYEIALFESNEKSLVTLDSIGDAVITTDVKGNITFINRNAEKLSDHSSEDAIGQHIDTLLNLYNIKTDKKIKTSIENVLYNNLTTLISNETLLKSKTGKEYIINGSASPLKMPDGKLFGTVLIFQDDTDRHRLDEELKYQYNILNTILNTTTDLIFFKNYLNDDGKYIICNKAFEIFTGKSNAEIVNHTDIDIFEEEMGKFFRDQDREIFTNNKTTLSEEWVKSSNNSKVLFNTVKAPYINEQGNVVGIVGVARDITKSYELKEALQSSHDLLDKLVNNVPGAIYQYRLYSDGHDSITYANTGFSEIFEVEQEAILQDAQLAFDRLHPDDAEMIIASIMHSAETQTFWNPTYRVVLPKKGLRWIEGFSKPERLEDGSILWAVFIRDITDKKYAEDELLKQKNILQHQAHHDALTGLPNRILFYDRLNQAIAKAKRNHSKFALLFIDLDHFKEINDSLGHDIGDEILKTVTSRLQKTIRDEDTLARLGGDEFTIILEDLHQVQSASLVSNQILNSLSTPMNINDNLLYVLCSIGISIYPDDGELSQNLLKFADSAMYKAKSEGRNNFQYYNSTLTELALERVVMESNLRAGLENNEFIVYYQPQIDGSTNTITGMEALVRWQHPTLGIIYPDKFIHLAESTGLIIELDRYVMKTAMTQVSQWYKEGFNPGRLAMNLAIKQLYKEDFIPIFKQFIKETGCKAEWLALEVTEGQIMTHPDEAIIVLQALSDLGVELAVDDFGTGYSSLAYLKKLPIDKLKIDQAFVRDLPGDEEDEGITRAVIALAKSLKLKVTAEGVETKMQRDFLIENECKDIQGYFYSKAIPAVELEALLVNGLSKRFTFLPKKG